MGKLKEESKENPLFLFSINKQFLPYLLLFFGIFTVFSLLSFDETEKGIDFNIFGRVGFYFSYGMFFLFGKASYIPGLFFLLFAYLKFHKKETEIVSRIFVIPILILSISIFLNSIEGNSESIKASGGFFGEKLSVVLEYIFGRTGKIISNSLLFLYSFLYLFRESPMLLLKKNFSIFKKIFHLKFVLAKNIKSEISKEEICTSKKRYELLPWLQISKKVNEVEPIQVSKKDFELVLEKLELSKNEKSYSTGTIFDGFFEDKMVFKFQRSSSDLIEKLTDIPTKFTIKDSEFCEPIDFIDEGFGELEKNQFTEIPESRELNKLDLIEDLPEIKQIQENENPEDIPESTWIDDSTMDGAYKKNKKSSLLNEEENLSLFPAQNTTVPEVKLKKSFYNISRELLSTNQNSGKDPLFKMEAEFVAKKIEEIIKEYGYDSKVVSWEKGPIITRYELTPPPGVKLGRITSLSDELKLYLAVKSIRIVAPIPGKSTIGIEVPNKHREDILLGDMIRESTSLKTSKELTIPLGKDISGKNVLIDLNKMPHLLVAGTTGSGKSVAMNSMISSLLFSKSPEEIRFLMIDPKIVEFAPYEDVPHLLMPVVTDPRKATKALFWAVQEMEARYFNVSNLRCRDLKSYNEKVELPQYKSKYKKMPYIIIFIDELSDLMMVSGKELEDYIVRITQKSRAVGIHLVMATQRPSVDVITGLIKANCPARIAFHVAQKTDSKIILDYNGADTLLGKGDMLYKSPTSADLQRIQAPYVSEDEVEKIVEECRKFGNPSYVDISLDEEAVLEELAEEDEGLFEEAWEIVRLDRKASASYLQRRMRIGYNKAARLMELMEEKGYVGPQIGSKQREILKS
ncbi:MAG: DNA translocase FtsK 4TM domain-containing protein [Leptospiraceae bacterium]|nr:DNA translocase FtsK 4TM domain-containing protein [Leptospiraceae bacterium]MCK6379764.1 DNA translocase FtsK 4TM domain-containing protein [Leptospiraceae bacterium]